MKRPPGASSIARISRRRSHCRAAATRQARRSASSLWSGVARGTNCTGAKPLRVGYQAHRRPGDRDVHAARRQAGRLLSGDARHAHHRGGGRAVLDGSAAGLAVRLRRGVVGTRADIGDPRAGVARRGDDDDPGLVRRSAEREPQLIGGDPPGVRREIDERVDQAPAGALRRRVRGRAGAPRGRSRRRRRGQLPRPHPRSRGGARRPAADLRARRSPDERLGGRRRPPAARLRRSGGRARGRRHPRAGRRRPGGRRCRHGGPLRLAGGPRRGLPPSGRARPAPRHGDQHGGHPPPAGALPAVGQRARRGHRDGDALGRRRGRPGLDRVGLPGLPGPHRRGRAASLARGRGAAVGAAARDARHGARAGRPVHRRAPGLPRSVPREDGALRGDHRGHEPAARRLVPRGAHRRRHRRRGRRSGVDAHARRDPGAPSRRAAGASPASSSRAPSSSVSTIPTGTTIPPCSRGATCGA